MPFAVPYVVTDDLDIVFAELSQQKQNMPSAEIVREASGAVINSLKSIFPRVDKIDAKRIIGFLKNCAQRESLPVISLTSLLNEPDGALSLELSRSVTHQGGSLAQSTFGDAGLLPRYSSDLSLKNQFSKVACRAQAISTEVALADDVVFTGGTIKKIITGLAAEGVRVRKLFTSVAMQDGIDAIKRLGVEVKADFIYQDVIDEVCMRDFIVGAPGGGRNVILPDGSHASAPYMYPFGQIEQWASIEGESAASHSLICLEASIQVWDETINASGQAIRFGDLEKAVLFCKPEEAVGDKLRSFAKGGANNAAHTYSL